ARYWCKPKHKNLLKVVVPITPDEVIAELKKLGVNISRNTLLNYEKWGLIPEAERGSHGKGKGRYADYPPETIAEAYASYCALRGLTFSETANLITPDGIYQQNFQICDGGAFKVKVSPRQVAVIRKRALDFEAGNTKALFSVKAGEGEHLTPPVIVLAIDWLQNKARIEMGVPPGEPLTLRYSRAPDGRLLKKAE
ncbi:MAG: hypothetical protein K6U74_09115, partial [Firmicutes bacterium]|nr:hypothetical protein [Bacillota bacterium]